MFKETKKTLKDMIYLKDKYLNITKKEKDSEKSFISDMQFEKVLKLANENSYFNIKRKMFESKVRLEIVDIIYAFSFMLLLPSIISYFIYHKLFLDNSVDGFVAYGGTFGSFIISGFLLIGLTSKLYEKFSGGISFHEIKKIRGGKAFFEELRKNKEIVRVFTIILNQNREMTESYKERLTGIDREKKFFYEVNFENFPMQEKKLIKSIINDIEKIIKN